MRLPLRNRSPAKATRDSVLFVAGLAGIGYETLVTQTDRPTLLILFAGMVGLPAFLSADESQKGQPRPDDPENTDRKSGEEL